MKELEIKIKDLYDFIAKKANVKPKNEKFIDVPFNLELEGKDGWEKCSSFVKKQSITDKIITEDSKSFEGAEDHMLMIDPECDSSIFVKDCDNTVKIPYMNTKISKVEKGTVIKDVYSPSMDLSHMYKDVNGFMHHNTYSVKLAIQDSWNNSALKSKGWKVVMKSGDIGSSISPVVAFFYTHRENEVIVLDDCDGFILNKQQSVQNFLKAILDQDVKAVSISPTIRNKVNDFINGKNKQSECKISVDQNKLQENILAVSVNDKLVCEEKISEADAEDFGKYHTGGIKSFNERMNAVMHRNHFLEADEAENETEEETDEELGFSSESDTPDTEDPEEIPEEFVFKSRMIMISNLFLRDVNQAVRSRCDCTEITLTPDEFCCRLKQIIHTLKMSDDSEYPDWMQEYAKNEVFGDLSAVLEIQKKGLSLFGNTITVADGVLQFRIIPELAGRWCSRCDIYCDDTGGNETEETLPDIAAAIRKNFIKYDLLKVLHGDIRDTKN